MDNVANTNDSEVKLNSVDTIYSEIEAELKATEGVDLEVLEVLKRHFLNEKIDKSTSAKALAELSKLAAKRTENEQPKSNNT